MLTQTPSDTTGSDLVSDTQGIGAEPDHGTGSVLRPAGQTAARERVRLEAGQGRSRLTSTLALMGMRVRHLGSAEAADNGRRYLPAVWLVIVIVGVAFWFPGRDDNRAGTAIAAGPVPTTVPSGLGSTSDVTVPIDLSPPTTAGFVFDSPTPVPTTMPFRPPATVPRRATTATPPTTVASVPLSVREYAWATSLNGASLSGVPDGTGPVANRIGTTDKVTYLRLDGTDGDLSLAEDPAGAEESLGAGTVKLCVVSDGSWQAGGGQSLDSMPPWTDTCVAGVEAADEWTFDLSGLGDPSAATGFALVPGDNAPAEFQLAFRVA